MATEVKIPIPDQTTEEVRVVKWHKEVGDIVAAGDVVLEVETDKSVIEVEAIGQGELLAQLFAVDDMVPVGQVVGFIGEKGEKVDAPAQAPKADTGSAEAPAPAAAPSGDAPAAGKTVIPEGGTEVKIPIPDQTTEEVRVVKWHKSVGDKVAAGDVVLEVETDKSVIEVEAVGSGVLLAMGPQVDDMVPVGQVVGIIGPEGAQASLASSSASSSAAAPDPTPAAPASAAKPTPAPAPAPAAPTPAITDSSVKASPVARNVAAQLGVDLAQVRGTGPQGRILRDDVERFAQFGPVGGAAPAPAVTVRAKMLDGRILASPNAKRLAKELNVDLMQVAGSGPNGRITGKDVQAAAQAGTAIPGAAAAAAAPAVPALSLSPAPGQPNLGDLVELTKMRRAIAMNLQMSSRDTPHFNATMSINMSRAMKIRKKLNDGIEKERRVSVNDLIVKACAVSLRQYPMINSRWQDTSIQVMPDINIGIATAVSDGLVVPVLTQADQRDWYDMATENKRLASSARQGKIIGAGKGTFTVSNLGMFGIEQFTGIINPPEAAILTVGTTQNEVVAVDGMIAIQPIMRVTLCSDHRIIDGALAAEFLRALKLYLEEQIQ